MPVFDLNKAKEAILKNEKQRKSLHGLSRKEIIALFPGRNIQDIENGIDIVLNEGILTCLFQNGKCVDASLTPNMEESTFNQSNKRGIENDPLSELLNFEIWNYLNNKNKETN
ncbi:MAG: hypothetical protein LIO93_02320 [Bacteroidales bacterium]|nr:hypothetical protein [Bacteroidales bacterium]